MVDYATGDYHEQRHPEFLAGDALWPAWSYFAYRSYIQPHAPRSVLEIGGAMGYNLVHAASTGIACSLVEPSAPARAVATRHGLPAYASLDEAPAGSADLILMRHVLEHIEDPADMLRRLRQRLSDRGRLVLVLPVEDPLRPAVPNDIDHHLYCWNPQAIANLCSACGYTLESCAVNHSNGRRLLLPLWRAGLRDGYCTMLRVLGRLRRCREIVVVLR